MRSMRRWGFPAARAADLAVMASGDFAQRLRFRQPLEPWFVENACVMVQKNGHGIGTRILNLTQSGECVWWRLQASLQAERGLPAIVVMPQQNLFRSDHSAMRGIPRRIERLQSTLACRHGPGQ